jgi:YcaO-like protein with predicted kinase domain
MQSTFDLSGNTPRHVFGGTARACSPERTLERIGPYLSQMGITRIAVVTGMDHIGIDTVAVTRPNARCVSVVQGKGCTLAAAKASGVMEAVEQYHAERVCRPLLLGRRAELSTSCAVADVRRLPHFVRAFSDTERLLWIEGVELRSQGRLWVPYDLVHLDFTLPLPEGSGCFLMGTSGLASGNSLLEAACHGVYELVERDAVTLFYLRAPEEQWRRRVDLSTIDDPSCLELLQRYERAEIAVAVWDVTSDVGLPCFLCSIVEREREPLRALGAASGAGCHSERGVALSRALTEAAQSRLTRISGARDDLSPEQLERLNSAEAHARSLAQVAPSPHAERPFQAVPSFASGSFEADIARCYACLEAAGLGQIIGVDLSLPQFPVSVVRMLVPGLEGFGEVPGYRPGARARRLMSELP